MSIGSLKLGTGVANGATKGPDATTSREGATSRPQPESTLPKPPESKDEVETRLDRTQPVSGDNDVARQTPEETFLDPPTPGEERKDTLEFEDVTESGLAPEPKPTADDGIVRFSSHPILKFKVGRFRFENGLLELRNEDDVDEFRKVLGDLPTPERLRIKELDVSAAEAQVRKVMGDSPRASKGIGSDTGDREPNKQVGKGVLGETHGE
jgi:hypothetical protein